MDTFILALILLCALGIAFGMCLTAIGVMTLADRL